MDSWQQSTLRADTEYRLRCFGNAILLHNQALDWARLEFEATAAANPDLAISRVVISHLNLAECYRALGEIVRAGDFYLRAQAFLVELFAQERGDGVRGAARHALGHVDSLWLDFLKAHRQSVPYPQMLRYHEATLAGLSREAATAVRH